MSYPVDQNGVLRTQSPPNTATRAHFQDTIPKSPSGEVAHTGTMQSRPNYIPLKSEDGGRIPADNQLEEPEHWVPYPLRPWFWIPFVVLLVAGAIGLEVALFFSRKNQGWPSHGGTASDGTVLHYVYTLPPVVVAAILVALWTWTDIEIKKLQPYIDLVHGDSPPHRSLLLDYTRTSNFFVWTKAASNKHYLVALASLMVVLSLAFQPLAAALLVVRDTWRAKPDMVLNNLGALGLNQNLQFNDLTVFLTAAGFAGASVLYNLPAPIYTQNQYTVTPFPFPDDVVSNGTLFVNTTAIKTDPGCQPASVQMVEEPDEAGWSVTATSNDCAITWSVDHNTTTFFGANIMTCTSPPLPPQFSPVIFWFFTYQPSARASATVCRPTLSFSEATVVAELGSSNITRITELRPFSRETSPFSSLSANITGQPLFGRAYNGVRFNLTNPDQFVLGRQTAIQLQLPAAVYQAVLKSPGGLQGAFDSDVFVPLSTQVYTTYLSLLAKEVYILPDNEPILIQVKTFEKRVWLSDTAVHLLAVAMFLLAIFGCIIQLFHREDRRALRLKHEPGTIASAVSIGAQTSMGDLLAGRQNPKDISAVLRDRKFRIDPETMKIVMEGEDGYEVAASPMNRRRSIFAALQTRGGGTAQGGTTSTKGSRGFLEPPSPKGSTNA